MKKPLIFGLGLLILIGVGFAIYKYKDPQNIPRKSKINRHTGKKRKRPTDSRTAPSKEEDRALLELICDLAKIFNEV